MSSEDLSLSAVPRHLGGERRLCLSVSPKEPGSDGSGRHRAHQDRNDGVPRLRRHSPKTFCEKKNTRNSPERKQTKQTKQTMTNLTLLRLATPYNSYNSWVVFTCFDMFWHVWGWPWWLWTKNWAALNAMGLVCFDALIRFDQCFNVLPAMCLT
jgi:hypothetical protein